MFKLFSRAPTGAVKKELQAIKEKKKEKEMEPKTTETVKEEIPQELINQAEQSAERRIALNAGGKDHVANKLASDLKFREEYVEREAKRLMGMSERERELSKPNL